MINTSTSDENLCGLKRADFQTTVNGKQTDLFILKNEFASCYTVPVTTDKSTEERFVAIDNMGYTIMSLNDIGIFTVFVRNHNS